MERKDGTMFGSSEASDRLVAKAIMEGGAKWLGYFDVVCRDAAGRVKWQERIKNTLTYQGSEYILKAALDSAQTRVTNGNWRYAIYTAARDATATGSTAATSECAGTGYARIVCQAGAWAFDQNPSYWRATATAQTFTAGGTWNGLWGIGVVDSASGAATWFLSFAQFSVTRNLAQNDTLQVQYRFTLSST